MSYFILFAIQQCNCGDRKILTFCLAIFRIDAQHTPCGVFISAPKRSSFTYYTEDALREAKDDIVLIAEKEGLTAHANAIKVRF